MSQEQPKSRGRARGKGRARSTVAVVQGPPRRPSYTVETRPVAPKPPLVERNKNTTGGTSTVVEKEKKKDDDRPKSGAGRGSVRGKRQIVKYENLNTKPEHIKCKQGISGTVIRLQANYFELQTRTDWCLCQYRVDFAPDEDRTNVRKQLFSVGCKDKIFGGYIFDGSMLFTTSRITEDPMHIFVDPIAAKGEKIRITVRLVGNVGLGDFHMIQFFNIIVRKCLSAMKLQMVGRNYYDAHSKLVIRGLDIELWPGYITSIRQHETKILLCCEISHKFMRNNNVMQVLRACSDNDRDNYKAAFTKIMIGAVVLTDYNNRTYRIDDVDWSSSPRSTFPKNDGSSVSYVEYYAKRYEIKISQTEQPMLVSRAKQRELRAGMAEIIYLVPELCRMTGLTDAERSNMQMMRQLASFTRLEPVDRRDRLQQYSERMHNTPEIAAELRKWDMTLAKKLVDFPARVLDAEKIVYDSGHIRIKAGPDADWTKQLMQNQMFNTKPVKRWIIITPRVLLRETENFVQTLQCVSKKLNFFMPEHQLFDIEDDRPGTYCGALTRLIPVHDPSLILTVCPNNKAERYAAIKKKCYVDCAVPSQVILKKNMISKGLHSIATKVAIQINCKLGGAPWTVEMPLDLLMVVGYDVCHDTVNKGRSFSAIVASLDRNCTRYFSAVTQHNNGEELSNDFALNLLKAVKKFQDVNGGHIPNQIIIYRDGVGDGQLPHVFRHEVTSINKILEEYYLNIKPLKLGFIIVTKRINTRLFNGSKNPSPGTVVDDVITLPQRYDFFLVSQCVKQGTVSPTSYNVLYDTTGLTCDRMQRLTYKLTHMYYNWSGTVRVPAPCQYAHKLAFLVSQSLHRDPNPKLNDTLYFL